MAVIDLLLAKDDPAAHAQVLAGDDAFGHSHCRHLVAGGVRLQKGVQKGGAAAAGLRRERRRRATRRTQPRTRQAAAFALPTAAARAPPSARRRRRPGWRL